MEFRNAVDISIELTSNSPGNAGDYEVTFEMTTGKYPGVSRNGTVTLSVLPGETSAPHSRLTGPAFTSALAFKETHAILTPFDAFDNQNLDGVLGTGNFTVGGGVYMVL